VAVYSACQWIGGGNKAEPRVYNTPRDYAPNQILYDLVELSRHELLEVTALSHEGVSD
jgi:hypothetical protein